MLCVVSLLSSFFFLSKIREWNFYYRDIYDHQTVYIRLLDKLYYYFKVTFSRNW